MTHAQQRQLIEFLVHNTVRDAGARAAMGALYDAYRHWHAARRYPGCPMDADLFVAGMQILEYRLDEGWAWRGLRLFDEVSDSAAESAGAGEEVAS